MKSLVFKLAILICATLPAVAQDGVKGQGIPFGASVEHEGVAAVLEAYENRVNRLSAHGDLTKEQFLVLFDEMLSDLDLMLLEDSNSRSSACDTACSLAQSGQSEICTAASLAASALSACPGSVYAIDADYYASVGCSTAGFAVQFACQGPGSKNDAIAWLGSARTRASKAWSNAWYAYSKDGCAQSYQAAIHASNAYVNFHNARTNMYDCY